MAARGAYEPHLPEHRPIALPGAYDRAARAEEHVVGLEVAVRDAPRSRAPADAVEAGDEEEATAVPLIVHTARLSPAFRGRADVLDITRKSGTPLGKVFAPSWEILRPALDLRSRMKTATMRGLETSDLEVEYLAAWERYVTAYTEEMRRSYRRNRLAWNGLFERGTVTLACYCAPDADGKLRCHRVLLASMLAKLGASYDGET